MWKQGFNDIPNSWNYIAYNPVIDWLKWPTYKKNLAYEIAMNRTIGSDPFSVIPSIEYSMKKKDKNNRWYRFFFFFLKTFQAHVIDAFSSSDNCIYDVKRGYQYDENVVDKCEMFKGASVLTPRIGFSYATGSLCS